MRPNAHTVALMSLACVLLCTGPLLAKPTRPVAHESARRVLVAIPSSRKASHARILSAPVASHTPWPQRGATHSPVKPAAKARPHSSAGKSKQSALSNNVETRAAAAYAADSAMIDRVHAWELTHRNPPAPHAAVADASPTPASPANPDDTTGSQSLLTDNSGLVRTPSELPRIKSIEEEAATPVLLQSLYDQRGRLVVPPPLYGSHEVLLHQNRMADHDGISRVRDDADILDLRRDKKLVELPLNETLRVDERLPANRRFSRPWTAGFLTVLARDFYASFHEPLMVDSAVRTVQVQRRLLRTNGNAAPASGETASPHLTGEAVDIAKSSLSLTEIAWMRTYLAPLIEQGKIDVEEEFQQSCFHISVYRGYLPATPAHVTVAAARPPQPDPSY